MWQILLGTYLILAILISIFIWSALVLAKESDQKADKYYRALQVPITEEDVDPNVDQFFQFPVLIQQNLD